MDSFLHHALHAAVDVNQTPLNWISNRRQSSWVTNMFYDQAFVFSAFCSNLSQLVLALCTCQQPSPNFLFYGRVLYHWKLRLLLKHGFRVDWVALVYNKYHSSSIISLASMKYQCKDVVRDHRTYDSHREISEWVPWKQVKQKDDGCPQQVTLWFSGVSW